MTKVSEMDEIETDLLEAHRCSECDARMVTDGDDQWHCTRPHCTGLAAVDNCLLCESITENISDDDNNTQICYKCNIIYGFCDNCEQLMQSKTNLKHYFAASVTTADRLWTCEWCDNNKSS